MDHEKKHEEATTISEQVVDCENKIGFYLDQTKKYMNAGDRNGVDFSLAMIDLWKKTRYELRLKMDALREADGKK